MSRRKIGIYAALLGPPILIGGLSTLDISLRGRATENMRAYVDDNFSTMIDEHEQALGLEDFDVPEVRFELPGNLEDYVSHPALVGLYHDDRVYVKGKIHVTDRGHFTDRLRRLAFRFLMMDPVDLKDTLNHEWGHYYLDQLHKSMGLGEWPPDTDNFSFGELFGVEIVSEGIARYIEYREKDLEIEVESWPKETRQYVEVGLKDPIWGIFGYSLIKPIIDEFGNDGIKYLILNPPLEEDLVDLESYRRRALEELRDLTTAEAPDVIDLIYAGTN